MNVSGGMSLVCTRYVCLHSEYANACQTDVQNNYDAS